jgi:crossover junction endonuclease MUS81
MDYIIKFDNREKELIKILEERGYNITLENLELGDIQFIDLKSKDPLILIERKTLADLSASIKDGRYKEQKDRMKHSIKKSVRKIVLIEGLDYENFSLPLKTIDSVIINTMIRDNIHIHLTKSKDETINFIENIILQLPKYLDDLKKEIVNGEDKAFTNEFSCKSGKKDNLTPEICFRNMLNQIPGVSTTISTVLVEKYKSIAYFTKELENKENRKLAIKSISEEKYGLNERRIGDKVGEKIYCFLFGEEINVTLTNIKNMKNNKNNISLFS